MTSLNYFDAMDYAGILAEYGRPEEFAERADCLAGVQALADVIEDWLRP